MTIITNPDSVIISTTSGDVDVRAFLNTLPGVNMAGKFLRLDYDPFGRITEIEVDPTVTLSAQDIIDIQDEFYKISLDTIIAALDSITAPPSATAHLTDQGASTPATITIGTQDQLTDISITDDWNLRPDSIDFSLTDDDTGELQYTGTVSKIVKISYSVNTGVTNSFDHVYSALMLTPDGGSKGEILGSRMNTETINGSNGMPIGNSITIKLDPLDKIKINIANADGTTNMTVSAATMSVK